MKLRWVAVHAGSWARAIRVVRSAPGRARRTRNEQDSTLFFELCALVFGLAAKNQVQSTKYKAPSTKHSVRSFPMSVDKDLVSVQQARDLVEAAHRAQAEVAQFDQAKIDRICEAMAKAALADAARLGAIAVEETGYGIPDDKREKNRFAAEDVWNYFRGLRTRGVV